MSAYFFYFFVFVNSELSFTMPIRGQICICIVMVMVVHWVALFGSAISARGRQVKPGVDPGRANGFDCFGGVLQQDTRVYVLFAPIPRIKSIISLAGLWTY